jgi:hypothetical protein
MSDAQTPPTEDVDALKARIAELEQEKAPRRRFDGRGFTAWVLVIVSAILFPIALTAYWGQRTLTDTQRYVDTVAPLAQDPTVRQAVGTKITTVITTQLDAQVRVSDLLKDYPRLQPLAGPIASGVNSFVGNEVDKLLASDRFETVWVAVNTKLQQSLVAALSGDPTGPVTIQGDQVILDTGDLIAEVKQRLVDRGLTIAANLPVPPIADRQVVLLTSPQLQTARTAYALGQPVAQWLIYVVLLMFVIAVLVSRRRARMVMAVGVAIVLGALVIRLAMVIGQNQLQMTLDGTPFEVAQNAFWTILTAFLLNAVRAAFALGLVLAVVGWFLSGTSSALAARRFFGGLISGAGGRASDTPIAHVGAWVKKTVVLWRAVIIGIAGIVVLTASPLTGSVILWTAVIAVLAAVVVEFLAASAPPAVEGSGEASDDEPVTVDVSG